jgi:hypothetical protein
MKRQRKLFKIVFRESESYTAYIFGANKKEVTCRVYETDFDSKANQDFETKVLRVQVVKKDEYPSDYWIND